MNGAYVSAGLPMAQWQAEWWQSAVALSREYTALLEIGAILENKRQYQHMHSSVYKNSPQNIVNFCN